MAEKPIEHKGIIQRITDKSIFVSIIAESACISCKAKGVCTTGDVEEKIIEVIKPVQDYSIGDHVTVQLKRSLGFRALFYGYILPFIVVLFALIILSAIII